MLTSWLFQRTRCAARQVSAHYTEKPICSKTCLRFMGGGDMIKEVKLRSFRPNTRAVQV